MKYKYLSLVLFVIGISLFISTISALNLSSRPEVNTRFDGTFINIGTKSFSCTDSDGGTFIFEKGNIVINHTSRGRIFSKVVSTDRCLKGKSNATLVEYYCNPITKNSKSVSYKCPNGCSNGACIQDDSPVCGNGMLEIGEQCDSDIIPDGFRCENLDGISTGPLTCTSECKLDYSACTTCGNYVMEAEEECDALPNWNIIGGRQIMGYSNGSYEYEGVAPYSPSVDCTAFSSNETSVLKGPNKLMSYHPFTGTMPRSFAYGKVVCTNCMLDFNNCTGVYEEVYNV